MIKLYPYSDNFINFIKQRQNLLYFASILLNTVFLNECPVKLMKVENECKTEKF